MTGRVTVLGATGGQGSAVVHALLKNGHLVRAVVRRTDSARARALADAGVELTRGDLTDGDSLRRSFAGADAAFAVTTPFEQGTDAEVEQGREIVTAAIAAGLPHLVLSSVASANRATGVPHFESKHRIEQILAEQGAPATVVAPTYFYDNLLGDLRSLRSGRLRLPLPPDRPLQQTARQDLGILVAAIVADRENHLGKRIEVASDAPSPAQMAKALSSALGIDVRAEQTPLSLVRGGSAEMGAMWEFLNGEGYRVELGALHHAYPGIAWTSFADWAASLSIAHDGPS
ncbi:NmrA/HSCARG family protein [Streptomyces justiciae]|uniref:NmrA/HSCARG family protein n=1 Tax=Streptomyces justiciae TaxID=2780140 RepID=A0ABU3M3W5_9ACTN|nr:NmrA/HSCARG family protein [Streptomyces justiciae]MDT7845644.1 NmrA/HSCARG family protein [Streptomyces justiciae]